MTLAGKSQMAEQEQESTAQVLELKAKLQRLAEERDRAVEQCEMLRKESMTSKQEL